MNQENISIEINEIPSTYIRGKYIKKENDPLTEEQIRKKKEKAKQYANEYYQKNKEKILERMKSKSENKTIKNKPIIVLNGRGRPPIHYFVSDANDVILKQESTKTKMNVDDIVLSKRQKKTEYMREYRKQNQERVREYVRKGAKKFYDKHSIELTEKKKEHYRLNREKILERLQKKRAEMKLLKEQEKEQQ